jgi:isocitrate/isopropylmalate dehydrogenase
MNIIGKYKIGMISLLFILILIIWAFFVDIVAGICATVGISLGIVASLKFGNNKKGG